MSCFSPVGSRTSAFTVTGAAVLKEKVRGRVLPGFTDLLMVNSIAWRPPGSNTRAPR